ncbi:MAG: hypothetical protein LBS17_03190 [Actinomycetes bacterium]|jgi:hypothetical protein|nr:hypothetical protein [Actinomycetes bacterium]
MKYRFVNEHGTYLRGDGTGTRSLTAAYEVSKYEDALKIANNFPDFCIEEVGDEIRVFKPYLLDELLEHFAGIKDIEGDDEKKLAALEYMARYINDQKLFKQVSKLFGIDFSKEMVDITEDTSQEVFLREEHL